MPYPKPTPLGGFPYQRPDNPQSRITGTIMALGFFGGFVLFVLGYELAVMLPPVVAALIVVGLNWWWERQRDSEVEQSFGGR